MASTSLPLSLTFNGGQLSSSSSSSYSLLHSSTNSLSPTVIRWGMQNSQDPILTHLVTRRSNSGTTFRVLVNANVSPGRGNYKGAKSEVIMVDPLEAKRIAAQQMQEIEAEEKLARKRRIEAINGAWAMLGLTAGLVIEGRTGDSILAQLTGYWNVITGFVAPLFPAEFLLEFLNQWQKLHLPWNITL